MTYALSCATGMETLRRMTTENFSHQLSDICHEIDSLDEQIKELKRKRQRFLEKKNQLEKALKRMCDQFPSADLSWQAEDFHWSSKLKVVLRETFKMTTFRDKQLSAINATLANEDVILVMSTGGGKSLCYQLPALINDGFTLVISPLVSLMQDQMMALQRFGINGSMLCQSTPKAEHNAVLNSMTDPSSTLKILFVTPEKLAKSKRFMSKLERSYQVKRLQRIAIDEVHCCSQWGHDFRPDYKFLNILRRQFPENVPILGLTATAATAVIDDLKSILNIPAALTFKAPFNRPNLHYEVIEKPTKSDSALNLLVDLLNSRFKDQCGIVYCFSRKETEELAEALRYHGLNAECYHADLSSDQRANVHNRWYGGYCRIIVATIAFGMGIDKSDVGFVVHHTIPKSIENYYQESGRAGRDGGHATCLIFYGFGDIFRQTAMVCTEKTGVKNLYDMVRYCLKSDQCRRIILAEHFDETYDPEWCDKKCDVCVGSVESHAKSIRDNNELCTTQSLKKFLSKIFVENKGNKMTGPRLAESLSRISRIPRPLCEHFITSQLLLDGLKQEFHFTPYNIICYVVPGACWFIDSDNNTERTGHLMSDGEKTSSKRRRNENAIE